MKIINTLLLISAAVASIAGPVSGDGGKPVEEGARIGTLPETAEILFVSNRDTGSQRAEIYSMDRNGKNVTRLTFTEEHHFIMGIDRSRRYIAASRAEEDTQRPPGLGDEDRRSLWLLDLETRKEILLTDPVNHAEGDSFSPDGEWIVFLMKLDGQGQSDIYKIRNDGTDLIRLTNTPAAIEGDPSWSNDGTDILFSYLDADTPRFVIKRMDVDGKNIETVYDGGDGIEIAGVWEDGNYDSSWSPDDEWIVFERAVKYTEKSPENFGSGIWHIFKIKRDGTELMDLSQAGGHTDGAEYLPSYSPDGRFIVFGSIFEADDPGKSHNDIFRIDSDGGSLTRLTDHPASDMFPVWIPARE
jgi:Tol biopolymer transport system component